MSFIDTHCHLYSEEFDADRTICIKNAEAEDVKKILLPNLDSSSINALYQTEKQYPNVCHAMMGLHPSSIKENYTEELKIIERELSKRKFTGIGEIGIDLYWDRTFIEEQKIAFKTQLQWAIDLNYPVSIHCRDAFDEIFEILDQMPKIPRGVFHCFTGTLAQAKKIINYNCFKLGIGGIITFKKSPLPEILENIELSHLVLETDAPYLAPTPFRGKRNEPAYLKYVIEKLAEIKNTTVENIRQICLENTMQIFDIPE